MLLICLFGAICCRVSSEEIFFPSQSSALCLLELVPNLALGWEGEGSAERLCGDSGQVPTFNGAIGECSLLLYLFNTKDVIGHARSFLPPRCHGKADINGVCVVKTVTDVGHVVELFSDDLVVVGVGVL